MLNYPATNNMKMALALTAALALLSTMADAQTAFAQAAAASLVTATSKSFGTTAPKVPADLVQQLQQGGNVIVFRYTGATWSQNSDNAVDGSLDDGQRISDQSRKLMAAWGQQTKTLKIPVDRVWSSEYYFVYQHALAALGAPVVMHRDLTGSLAPFFRDAGLLETSLQGLRNRTVTPPPAGTNTVLFTHQGKFEKAYGYYLDAGQTLIFQPDGSGLPRLIANLSYDQFMALK